MCKRKFLKCRIILDNNEIHVFVIKSTKINVCLIVSISNQQIDLIEKYLEEELSKRIENFSMGEFTKTIMYVLYIYLASYFSVTYPIPTKMLKTELLKFHCNNWFFRERKNELEGEIFEMLLTFSDFMSFKEMFLDYRAVRLVFVYNRSHINLKKSLLP